MNKAIYGLASNFIFKAAVSFLKNKTPLTAEEYKKLDSVYKAKAFTVSGYTSLIVLQAFLDELESACESGKTKKDFMETMNGFLTRNGYEGINPFHADVIFRTNIQTAYNAGHYKSMTDPAVKKLRPYWKYVTAGDSKVRQSHVVMDGRIYPADDPVWDIWYPPNGFRCRCSVISLSKRQVEESGMPVSKGLPYDGSYKYPDKGFSNNPAKDAYKPDLSGVNEGLKKAFNSRKQRKSHKGI